MTNVENENYSNGHTARADAGSAANVSGIDADNICGSCLITG
ncbi:hypothetical protein AFEL58S_01885 [Afipia felis]